MKCGMRARMQMSRRHIWPKNLRIVTNASIDSLVPSLSAHAYAALHFSWRCRIQWDFGLKPTRRYLEEDRPKTSCSGFWSVSSGTERNTKSFAHIWNLEEIESLEEIEPIYICQLRNTQLAMETYPQRETLLLRTVRKPRKDNSRGKKTR